MIAFLRGKFSFPSAAQTIIDVNGVGYEVQISLNTYSTIQNQQEGQLFTYLHITENAQTLYGFSTMEEKKLFLHLISVSGVGASTARMMLSGMAPEELMKSIVQNNVKQLESIKGIGKKTAERLIVELKDKLTKQFDNQKLDVLAGNITAGRHEQDALEALIALGIGRPLAEKAVQKAMSHSPESKSNVELLIKAALKNL
ncbi:MAG: Holliday junction branch migration protein RuvA [Pseudopedobacter saltans]|uniref:Holliday junction branch migration complex subunit RuvA n=1 Tax=Pseudopedobacter saltans TaxID=151895 RepID=A0A2W5F859_9SPHI|nr:MAG: Holliday junction branch migration protein RuvA [Pseudopedobacter saltans]